MRRPSILSMTLFVALCATGCKPEKQSYIPICRQEVLGSEAEEAISGEIPYNVWFSILLRNYNNETGELKRPEHDCSGRDIGVFSKDETAAACIALEDKTLVKLQERPLQEADLFIGEADEGRILLWAQTTHFEGGIAQGPVAIAGWTDRGVEVRTIGTLRAHVKRATLRLETMGKDKVLVVESRKCDPQNPNKCHNMMRLLPVKGYYFVNAPLVDQQGGCLGPAAFDMFAVQEVELDTGIRRKFELARSVDFADDGSVLMNEQVTIKDADPAEPEAPPKLFRKANVKRPLQLSEGGFVTREGLWEKMLAEHGSVRPGEKQGAVVEGDEASQDDATVPGGKPPMPATDRALTQG